MNTITDAVTTFDLLRPDIRGRIIRMGPELDKILCRHEYPQPIARLTAETILLTALLSSMLKYEGLFSLQAQGNGPVRLLASDITSQGVIRGCASFDREREIAPGISPFKLLGAGHLAFTVDQGEKSKSYQGVVELKGDSLKECVQHYFKQSEQIHTGICLALARQESGWRGGGILLQSVPGSPLKAEASQDEDAWRRVMMLLQTCTDQELLDPGLSEPDLLFRLFHEEGIKIYEPAKITSGCRCSQKNVDKLLGSMSAEEVDSLAQNGKVEMKCDFCGITYYWEVPVSK